MVNFFVLLLGVALGDSVVRAGSAKVRALCALGFVVALFGAYGGGRLGLAWVSWLTPLLVLGGFVLGVVLGVVSKALGGGADMLEGRGGRVGAGVAWVRKYAVWFFAALGLVLSVMPSKKAEKPIEAPAAAIIAPAHAAPLVSNAGPGAAVDAGPGAASAAPVGVVAGDGSGAAAVVGCDCSAGAVCTGPRGGKFCVDASGNKRYR